MGNKLAKEANKHASHVPTLDETIPKNFYKLPTGAIFVAMSPVTGDLPITAIPPIIKESDLDVKDYQDAICMYFN